MIGVQVANATISLAFGDKQNNDNLFLPANQKGNWWI